MAATLKQIAEKAEVSQAAVSLALNHKPGVSRSTREKILKIAHELDYGARKRGLIDSNRIATIRFLKIAMHGHTVNHDHDVFIVDYIDGLTQGARDNSLNLEVESFDHVSAAEVAASVAHSNLQGVVVLGTELSRADIQAIGQISVPVVFLDTFHDYLDFDFVDMNNIDSVYKIVNYLANNGHKDIGLVRSGVGTRNFQLRDEGFHRAMSSLSLRPKTSHIYTVDSTYDGAYRDMLNYLERRPALPTALFCVNDIIAYGCIKALRECGYQIPADVSVVGFDDLPLSSLMEPPLTTMQVSKREIGRLAINRLAGRNSRGKDSGPVKIQVGGRLMVRASVKTVGSPD